ncbi:YifB family Mg chelatase-like AAA ATPase [Halarcobacter bivalviorum]|uniref:Fis family transcriptional regulator n=1 Tax=Halarcobacter bivalviorum TaxID=663364 RepID=A0AAX2A4S1_9BACT|nr:YifB family Mg chelatase-like AAA ATPase [Halarcobacter bivalviorum]AXH13013.1 magnesium chelatase-related protein [Halarcobacter bivalviorum]RXK09182.1 Fis family transcriptional regulator [Halarcobacter bivalviorum]
MKIIKSATLVNIEANEVNVEATFTKGLPSFTIVGLPSDQIKESKDRVKSALLTNEYKFPPKKITINLAPSEIKKTGTHFDLPIALLISLYEDKKIVFDDIHIFGELSLNGEIKDSNNIFPIILSLAKENKIKNVLVCNKSAKKISKIPNINIYCVKNLLEAIAFFHAEDKKIYLYKKEIFKYEKLNINGKEYYFENFYENDFIDIKGQENAKRAALIAAAGNHNILLEGSPGCGKSMLAKRLPFIMAPMSLDEILEIAKLQALDLKEPDFRPLRVSRSPHCSSTKASIVGSSNSLGEIALANAGVLFFDELPHFPTSILESLREPLEDNSLLISRANSKVKYKTKFLFIGAMNPCPCGNLLSRNKSCRCNELEIRRYKNRLSEPFLDRIDLYVIMNETNIEDKPSFNSKSLHEKVIEAFKMQILRGQDELNGKLNDKQVNKFCILDEESRDLLYKATNNFNLSFRSMNKVLKVARTIADLESSLNIKKEHILESLNYRKR